MVQDLKNISSAPILNETEAAKKLSAQKALDRRQTQIHNIPAELGKTPIFEDVGMDKGDIGMEIPLQKNDDIENNENDSNSDEQKETQKFNEYSQQTTNLNANMAISTQQQRTSQIRRSIQLRQNQIEQTTNKIKTLSKKITSLQGRARDGKKLTLILKVLSVCTIVGAALAFFIKHIVNFFTDSDKIEEEIKSLQKKINSEETNKKNLEKSLQNEYQILNQNQ
ncbi:MAG: hypothetical protein COU29_01365 [Candidatus Magasanikbacteria bacterium CG10_big_fil_rev_8_21_14_0_10_36_32]|uniref:Uncharacterized protein n=1 Tax=Candidatus Magasanikbacteria bacterium CG10_big_fil_rev_8_21_14_0_10_36_32 TaxID=1974646 RepID=A0A2M6W6K4_9BACT|nr:MAG: hypothetical protein COU29_01365 [Candidatus Magasanikbacteria bacterium CG10_big_fil_rev_8_21_14_0_10_36_32]